MKRKNRFVINSALLSAYSVALIDVLLQSAEKKRNGDILTWKNFDGHRSFTRAFWGGCIGAGISYFKYDYKLCQEQGLPFNPDQYISEVLMEENLKSDPYLLNKFLKYRREIKENLWREFRLKLCCLPLDAGSFTKRTAIVSNYDLDIILAFRKNSYRSLKEMYDDVYMALKELFGNTATIAKQTKTIGITFHHQDCTLHFDIVPGREINNYIIEKNLNLYVKPDFFWEGSSSFKMNTDKQKNLTIKKPRARRVIKLLKKYKDINDLPLPSVVIEQCVVEAVSENMHGISSSDTENLLNSMDHIVRKFEHNTLIDKFNSNNNLNNKLTDWDKSSIKRTLFDDIKEIESNPRHLKEIL